jgi:hypothetical protein
MRLLVKARDRLGLAAHIPDLAGQPLCGIQLNPATWHIEEPRSLGLTICKNCRREQAKQQRKDGGTLDLGSLSAP